MDLKRTELLLRKFYDKEIRNEETPILINHGILDTHYYEIADQLIHNYYTTKDNIKTILNDITLRPTNIDVKFYNIQNKELIHNIHSQQQGQLIEITGKIIRTTKPFPQVTVAAYECSDCCNITRELIKPEQKIKETKKFTCARCNHTSTHSFDKMASKFDDVQIITVQENREDAPDGHKPAEIKCILKNEDVDTIKAGDIVTLNGVVELRNSQQKNLFEEYILVEYIQNENEDYGQIELTDDEIKEILKVSLDEDIILKFRDSIAPTIYGCDEIKEAVVLQLFGSDREERYNSYTRGDIHILLVGDAGLGKSQILKFVSNLAPRGIYTSGKSSSGAGLTAVAMQDANGGWTLEAGAMVLADKGFLCIDELDKMSETDRSSMHEALEQQTISVSKAGLNTTLDSRCSVLAAANPKFGSFDEYNTKFSLTQQINLGDTLQSRFDLIFIMIDNGSNEEDMLDSLFDDVDVEVPFDPDFIRKYISYAKQEIHPRFTPEAKVLMKDFFATWRKHHRDTRSGPSVTNRQSGALKRLSKAAARARLSDKVEEVDVQRAVRLAQYCIDSFETQMSEDHVEKVGYIEDINNKDTNDKLLREIKFLAADYENCIPANTIYKRMSEYNISQSFVSSWLRSMDSNELMICDVSSNAWSCVGEWYKKE